MEQLIHWDENILIFLNRLGSPAFDDYWLWITHQQNWLPLYILIGFLYFYYLGWKKALISLVLLAIFLGICDQTTNFFKAHFHRLRPSQDPNILPKIRDLIHPKNYSFISGHASNSTIFVWFSIYLLKKYTRYIYILVIWWLLFMYSRIYVGVHYPLDIIAGILWGGLLTVLSIIIFKRLNINKDKE